MTRDAKVTVISWLTVLIVLGLCVYFTINIVQKHKEENEIKTAESVGNLGTIKVNINGTSYDAVIESNNTAKEFLNLLPMTLNMSDSDGNRKYSYMYSGITATSPSTRNMSAGDIALSGKSTIVVFYKATKSSGKFIKLGHIDNLPDLGSSQMDVSFSK